MGILVQRVLSVTKLAGQNGDLNPVFRLPAEGPVTVPVVSTYFCGTYLSVKYFENHPQVDVNLYVYKTYACTAKLILGKV